MGQRQMGGFWKHSIVRHGKRGHLRAVLGLGLASGRPLVVGGRQYSGDEAKKLAGDGIPFPTPSTSTFQPCALFEVGKLL